jgi:hypothetical protein
MMITASVLRTGMIIVESPFCVGNGFAVTSYKMARFPNLEVIIQGLSYGFRDVE